MPQPLPVGRTVHFGPDFILQRPELAAQAANVCSNWALIETRMMYLYAWLMGSYLPQVPGFAPPTHPVALQVFDALNSLAPRIDLLERLIKWRATPEESEEFERTLKPLIKKRFSERSIVAHGQWGVCADYPNGLILTQTFGTNQIYTLNDFEQVSGRILELHQMLNQFSLRIYERLRQ